MLLECIHTDMNRHRFPLFLYITHLSEVRLISVRVGVLDSAGSGKKLTKVGEISQVWIGSGRYRPLMSP